MVQKSEALYILKLQYAVKAARLKLYENSAKRKALPTQIVRRAFILIIP